MAINGSALEVEPKSEYQNIRTTSTPLPAKFIYGSLNPPKVIYNRFDKTRIDNPWIGLINGGDYISTEIFLVVHSNN